MGNNTAWFLKLSGSVPPGKRKEFEQTFRFVSNQLPPDCLQFSLSADIYNTGMYHFFSLWPSAEALNIFSRSTEFQVLQGAYQTLGSQDQNMSGKLADTRIFELLTNQ
jgi:quinol monooxygenase YgiN